MHGHYRGGILPGHFVHEPYFAARSGSGISPGLGVSGHKQIPKSLFDFGHTSLLSTLLVQLISALLLLNVFQRSLHPVFDNAAPD